MKHLKQIERLAAQYLPDSCEQVQYLLATAQASSTQPVVVVYGVYNAGKSSLLNALTGHVNDEYFVTSDIPETRQTKTLVHEGIHYIDTPGLDVNEDDTRIADTSTYEADIILLVHKLTAGTIQAADLEKFAQRVKAQDNTQGVFAVLTCAESSADQTHLINAIAHQLKPLAPDCEIFPVSNPTWRKGVLQNSALLKAHSGIPKLLERLSETSATLSDRLEETRVQKTHQLKQKIMLQIKKQKEGITARIDEDRKSISDRETRYISAVKKLQKLVSQGLERD